MIVHILHMYNSKHPHTWDESLPYVQHSYNRALHSSTDHNPFQVGLGFQPLGPIDVALPLAVTSPTHLLLQLKLTKPPGSLSGSNTSTNRFRISYRSPMTSTSNTMINIGCHISFRWATKFGCTCRKNTLQDPIESFTHSIMGPYTITKAMGDNSFELNIPPFLGLHPVFNVDLLRPYFPPLLDTSEVAEQLTPTELNPNCIQ
jgi:hypothetical protein